MKSIVFILSAYITGVLAAVPAGPVQIEVVRRSINGHLRSAMMVILGAMTADIAYGIIAFFGIAPFLKEERTRALFSAAGGVLLIVLGIIIIRQNLKGNISVTDSSQLGKKRWALVGGFSLSATNPMMILWWLIAARLFMDLKLIDTFTDSVAISFLTAGGAGLASYLVFLSLFLFWARKFVSDRNIRKINLVFGVILLFIAAYFTYTAFLFFSK